MTTNEQLEQAIRQTLETFAPKTMTRRTMHVLVCLYQLSNTCESDDLRPDITDDDEDEMWERVQAHVALIPKWNEQSYHTRWAIETILVETIYGKMMTGNPLARLLLVPSLAHKRGYAEQWSWGLTARPDEAGEDLRV